MSNNIKIIGAGMAGLIAACRFPDADIFEAGHEQVSHRALLRFRNDSVSRITGIAFKEVTVEKGVWDTGSISLITGSCPLDLQNKYSIKVTGGLLSRSLRNIEPTKRFIAPDDFQQQLVNRFRERINFNTPIIQNYLSPNRPPQFVGATWINTAPLRVIMDTVGMKNETQFSMTGEKIFVDRYELAFEHCDVYQTIYFPDLNMDVYRASITGKVMIIESVDGVMNSAIDDDELEAVCRAFGLSHHALIEDTHERSIQRLGKIVDLPRDVREGFLYALTRDHNVFSLGRFACWRNILLDDVANDIETLARLINSSDYSRRLNM